MMCSTGTSRWPMPVRHTKWRSCEKATASGSMALPPKDFEEISTKIVRPRIRLFTRLLGRDLMGPGSNYGTTVDPITTEVIRNQFISAAEEMKFNLMRSAYNPVVFENCDFAVGVFDAEANMIAQAPGLPVFLGTLRENVKVITEDIGGLDRFKPGDLYMTNDPYAGGTHLLDVTCVVPVFYGDEILGFSVAKTHWLDVGGKDAGSYSNDTRNIHQEGLRLRSVKLYDAGIPVKSIFDMIKYNVRVSESVLGDL